MDKANRVFISLRQLTLEDTMPDSARFLLLNVCSHAGLLEGRVFFDDMCKVHCITPQMRLYTCMVGIFGRGGHFN